MKHRPTETPPDKLPQAPLWVLSFADMITNLMAAFVMLQAFASATPTEGAFKAGQGSFRRAIKNFGLPSWMVNRGDPPPLAGGDRKTHSMDSQDEPNRARVIDAEGDDLRQVFDRVAKATQMESTDPHEETLGRTVTPVSFPAGGAELTAEDREYLQRTLADKFRQSLSHPGARVLVLGLAPEGGSPGSAYMLSARRAAAAAGVLRAALDTEVRTQGLEVGAWGVGEGAKWQQAFGGRPGRTYILAALIVPR